MKVIALEGESNVGKTQTLSLACELLLHANFEKIPNRYMDLDNGDFSVILKGYNKNIGILTQGDYLKTTDLLQDLEEKGCDICLCACTNAKDGLKEKLEEKFHPKFVLKKKDDLESQNIGNLYTAVSLIVLLEEFYNNNIKTI